MKIGIDGIPLSQLKTGVGHYTFEIADAVARYSPTDNFELLSYLPFDPVALNAGRDHPGNLKFINPKVNWLRKHWWTIGLPLHLKKQQFDLFHGTNYDVPILRSCPTVLTIHDLSQLLHSETHEKRSVRRARRRLPLMARVATLIIVPTLNVRDEVHDHLGTVFEKLRVVPYAPRRCFRPVDADVSASVRKRLGIEDQFILYVGTIEPRKNIITLVRAFEAVVNSNRARPQLVLAGKTGWLTSEFFAYLEQSNVRERIILTGYLPDEELAALYSSCTLMVFPAIYEGGGLPPIEAMACGAPVVSTDTPSISEMTGNGARLFTPRDHNQLAQIISELLDDDQERKQLAERGRARAAQFSWERAAKLTYDVYEEALKIGVPA